MDAILLFTIVILDTVLSGPVFEWLLENWTKVSKKLNVLYLGVLLKKSSLKPTLGLVVAYNVAVGYNVAIT